MRLKLLRQRDEAAHIHGSEWLAVIQRPKNNDLSPSSLDFVLHGASDEFLGYRVEVANELNKRNKSNWNSKVDLQAFSSHRLC